VARLTVFRKHAARCGKRIRRRLRGARIVCGWPRRRGRCLFAATRDEDCNDGYQKQC